MKRFTAVLLTAIAIIFFNSQLSNAQVFTGNSGASIGSIPDNGATATCFPLAVSGVGTINGTLGLESVTINIRHAYVRDLVIKLVSPDGTTVLLSNKNGGFGQNYTNTVFVGQPTTIASITIGTAPFTGTFLPEEKLGLVNNGQNADGDWTLCVQDASATKIGRVLDWSLKFSSTPAPTVPIKPLCSFSGLATSTCSTAPLFCTGNSLCGNTSAEFAPPHKWPLLDSAFCGNIENNSFIRFVAKDTSIKLNVWVSNSLDNLGIQMFFFSGVCNGAVTGLQCEFQLQPQLDAYPIYASGLVPGQTYYLMFDGFAGDVCDYTVQAVSGIELVNFSTSLSTPNICKGNPIQFIANSSIASSAYNWSSTASPSGINVNTKGDTAIVNTSVVPVGSYIYQAAISSVSGGCTATKSFTVNIIDTPKFIQQTTPILQQVYTGYPVKAISVKAAADSIISYQWYSNTTNSWSGASPIGGATQSSYWPSSSVVGTMYYFCVINNGGCKAYSNIASVVVTNAPACPNPDTIAFVNDPDKVYEGSYIQPSIVVRKFCKSTGANSSDSTTSITITAKNACGFAPKSVKFTNGLAVFDSLLFTRGYQKNIQLIAKTAGIAAIEGVPFSVLGKKPNLIRDTLRSDDFSPSPKAAWTPPTLSTSIVVGSGGVSGSDVSGVVNLGGNYYFRKSYSANNTTGKGTKRTITFVNNVGLSVYDTLLFGFKLASLNQNGVPVKNTTYSGVDSSEDALVETSTDGGITWQPLLTHLGGNNKLFSFSANRSANLSLNSNKVFDAKDSTSSIKVQLPKGTSQFMFRFSATNNRTDENWCIDDVFLIGSKFVVAAADSIPKAKVLVSPNPVCVGSVASLSASISSAHNPVSYHWSPSNLLANPADSSILSPTSLAISSPKWFTLTISDSDNCVAKDSILISPVKATSSFTTDYICTGDTYLFNDSTFTQPGTYIVHLTNTLGCDSAATLELLPSSQVTPKVKISASSSYIPSGALVTFIANASSGGSAPTYQWYKNGVAITGAINRMYKTNLLQDFDTISVQLTSNALCSITPKAVSNKIIIRVVALYSINGNVRHPKGYTIPNVTLNLSDGSIQTTSTDGLYGFSAFSATDYVVKAEKHNEKTVANGISVIDVLIVQSHILGKTKLNSPYKIIAADVNSSGDISTLDLLLIKRMCLGIDTIFPKNKTWAFVDSAYQFPDSLNPFPYKDSLLVSNLTQDLAGQSFIGVKLGDVTWDWNPALLGTSKQTQPIQLYHEDIKVGKYQSRIIVPIRVRNFRQLLGGQFTLHFNPEALRLVGLEKRLSSLEYGTNHAAAGNISFLWTNPQLVGETLADGSLLVNLILEKKQDFESESLTITSDITPVEAYDSDMRLHGMEKTSGRIVSAEPLPIAWNISPNPSTGKTVLQYNASTSASLSCNLMTTTGKTVFTQRLTANAGNNQWPLNFNQSGKLAAGVYYLKVEGLASGTEVKKVVIQ